LFTLTGTSSLFTHARATAGGVVHAWHEHSTAAHDLMENGVSDDAEELRVEVGQLRRAMLPRRSSTWPAKS
jgi:hypothetical protein